MPNYAVYESVLYLLVSIVNIQSVQVKTVVLVIALL